MVLGLIIPLTLLKKPGLRQLGKEFDSKKFELINKKPKLGNFKVLGRTLDVKPLKFKKLEL